MTALARLFAWKVRGLRVVELIGVCLVAAMVLSVYAAKTAAARESARIAELERSIAENRARVRLLRAEAARLESPTRLAALSAQAGLQSAEQGQLVREDRLDDLAAPPAVLRLPEGEVVR